MENQQGLVKVEGANGKDTTQEYAADLKSQAEEYGQKVQDAAVKAKDFAAEKYAVINDKFKEFQNKEPKELIEDAKEFTRQKPGQALMITAAAGLVLGWLLRRK